MVRNGYDIVLFTDGDVRHWHLRPLGPQRLATELRKHGYTVKVVDFFSRWLTDLDNFYNLIDSVVDDQTLFIGFSGTFFNSASNRELLANINTFTDYFKTMALATWPLENSQVEDILNHISTKYPSVKFVYGGERYDYKLQQLSSTMDFIVQGFADTTIIQLANHLSKNTSIKYMPSGSKAKIINHDKDASSFNFSTESAITFEQTDHMFSNDPMPLETSRGCMFKCTFCGYPVLGRKKKDLSYHKTTEVLAYEFSKNYEMFGTNKYIIVDNIFNETTEKIEDVLRARDISKVDLQLNAFIRYEILARYPEQYKLLKELGLVAANIGIESLHLPSARVTGKGTDPEKVKEILYSIKSYWDNKISISGSFIIGLPEDNPETLSSWIPWVVDKDCPIDGLFLQRMNFSQLGTTLMSQDPGKYGYTNVSVRRGYDYWKNKYWTAVDADRYALDILETCWASGRLKVSGIDIMGLQSAGYTFDELLTTSMKDLPFAKLLDKTDARWETYHNTLFEYESKKCIN